MVQIFSTRTDKPHAYQFGEYQNQLAFDPVEIATSSDLKTWTSSFDIADLTNVYLTDFDWLPSVKGDTYATLGARNGTMLTNKRYDQRDMVLLFYAYLRDADDQKLALQALSGYLAREDPYWITFSNAGYHAYKVQYKSIAPTYIGERYMTIQVTLNNLTGVSQSAVTTQNIDNITAYGLGLNGLSRMNYTFSDSSFSVYNAGDLPIDPVVQNDYLLLTIKGNGKVTLKNNDTGDSFTYNTDLHGGDILTLNGVNPYLNGSNCGLNTNNGIIRLKQGENHFSMSGGNSISFDFYFKYLN